MSDTVKLHPGDMVLSEARWWCQIRIRISNHICIDVADDGVLLLRKRGMYYFNDEVYSRKEIFRLEDEDG